MGIWEINAGELLFSGGPIMVPIVICSIVALGIVLGKLIYFAGLKTNTVKLKADVFALLTNNKVQEALSLCRNSKSPVAKILKAGILKFEEKGFNTLVLHDPVLLLHSLNQNLAGGIDVYPVGHRNMGLHAKDGAGNRVIHN